MFTMGSCCCKKKIKIVNKLPREEQFDCIKPSGKIILSYDEQFEVPRFEIKFDGFYETTMRIWSVLHKKVIEKKRNNFY